MQINPSGCVSCLRCLCAHQAIFMHDGSISFVSRLTPCCPLRPFQSLLNVLVYYAQVVWLHGNFELNPMHGFHLVDAHNMLLLLCLSLCPYVSLHNTPPPHLSLPPPQWATAHINQAPAPPPAANTELSKILSLKLGVCQNIPCMKWCILHNMRCAVVSFAWNVWTDSWCSKK